MHRVLHKAGLTDVEPPKRVTKPSRAEREAADAAARAEQEAAAAAEAEAAADTAEDAEAATDGDDSGEESES